jgi:hypothetical protein
LNKFQKILNINIIKHKYYTEIENSKNCSDVFHICFKKHKNKQ